MNLRTVAFYSYKGGVGRSLSLLNVAYQLSQQGQRVGLVDLDVEAAGLNQMLNLKPNAGHDLLDLLAPENRDLTRLERAVLEVQFDKTIEPRVFLLPTVADSQLLDSIKWDVATQRFLSADLFPHFAKVYRLDYVLIDARSGLSESATFVLRIADLEVLVCRLDTQNRFGLKGIVEVCEANRKSFLVVASACPEKGRTSAIKLFRSEVGTEVNFVLPYDWKLYYKENVISATQPNHPLSKVYAAIARKIRHKLNESE